jgi:hypothetical protein
MRVTRMARPVDRCTWEMRMRVRWSESRTLIWSRGEGRPFEKNKMHDTMSEGAVPQKFLCTVLPNSPVAAGSRRISQNPPCFVFHRPR